MMPGDPVWLALDDVRRVPARVQWVLDRVVVVRTEGGHMHTVVPGQVRPRDIGITPRPR